jgi:hypothetical protein
MHREFFQPIRLERVCTLCRNSTVAPHFGDYLGLDVK